MFPHRYWMDFKTTDFENIDPQKTIAILPTASVEQHGPHLPVGVDSYINQGMLETLCARAPAAPDFRILPLQCVGKADEHIHAAGTLSLKADTAAKYWIDIGISVARYGIRKMIIANSHGGNLDLIGIVARELRIRCKMLVGKCHWSSFGAPDGLYSADELKFGVHGGDEETSLMLHFRPGLVDMQHAQDFRSSAQDLDENAHLGPTGLPSYGWITSDLNPHGTVGNAANASSEKGRRTAEHQVDGFIEFLQETANFDIDRFN
ncbi:creatininase family protein [Pseudovibrio sp. Tun.PSC04-5.I4]|uniref:creatininase family protein n=1 Tax=Pseudovibrio sp. Tun.PSC04-5.I4 TaxID=1798213 RepID=UPI00087F520D|nr:creatininase family protein [Pseudovibrio sp. Tun.PSC04-5.I4]SDR20998.1 creatinine amidohydrolase [Pseudovibrio sp. Tun.PSC04-5.I4]